MQRLSNDRGAVAVIVAVLMVPLLGFAAISIDMAATHAEKQQLQTGADAAALAIAQDCARKDCSNRDDTARQFVELNSTAEDPKVSATRYSSGKVTVTADSTRQHWFAPVLGINESDIQTSANAGWGSPGGGRAAMPLVFSWCSFKAQTGGGIPSNTNQQTISLPKKATDECTGPSGNPVPGGFGWIVQSSGQGCSATTRIGERVGSDTGNNIKCTSAQLAALRYKTLLLPIYEDHSQRGCDAKGNEKPKDKDRCKGGSNAWYEVHAYAAFTLTGYFFGNNENWNITQPKSEDQCKPNNYCIQGFFTQMHDRDPNFDYDASAPNLGASAVFLLPDQ